MIQIPYLNNSLWWSFPICWMVRQDFHGKSEKIGKIAKSESISWQPKMGCQFLEVKNPGTWI